MRSTFRRALVACAALSTSVAAAPHKVMVLPLDGNAPPALRAKLGAELTSLAQGLGALTPGDTTFPDTAAAVGCDAAKPKCVDTVMATLAVDELVWGTATTANGVTTVVVHRASRGQPATSATATLPDGAAPETARPELAQLFPGATTATGSGATGTTTGAAGGTGATAQTGGAATGGAATSSAATGGAATGGAPPAGGSDTAVVGPAGAGSAPSGGAVAVQVDEQASHDRAVGIGLAIGGGVTLLVGFSLWLEESSVQGDIDNHPTNTLADFQALAALENKAGGYATGGNLMTFVGVGLGAAGAYYLWRAHGHVTSIAPAPAAQGTGMTLTIGGRW